MKDSTTDWFKVWILVSVWASATGWGLSAAGMLNRVGWAGAMLLISLIFLAGLRSGGFLRGDSPQHLFRWHRLRRPLPALYHGAVLLAFLGGALFPPNNYDALTYRLPRMLHWLAADRWHWIATPNGRMNYSGTGFEWLQTAFFALTKSDRIFFLLNWIPFLLLPGLVFSVFRRFGVHGRVAWFWMWFLPLTYGIALQAGSVANDAFACGYTLTAVLFAQRAARRKRIGDLCFAILAAALLTGVKASNLPLLLPIVLAAWPARRLLRPHALAIGLTILLGLVVSMLPIAVGNYLHTGDWTGDPGNRHGLRVEDARAGLLGNGIMLLTQSLTPPLFPRARAVAAAVRDHLPRSFVDWMHEEFPKFSIQFGELPQEEVGGVGLGCSLLLMLLMLCLVPRAPGFAAWFRTAPPAARQGLAVGGGALVAMLFYMVQLGSESTARLLTPYYPLLLLLVALPPVSVRLVRRWWWSWIAAVSAFSTLVVLLIIPARPLLPIEQMIQSAALDHPGNAQLQRVKEVYAVYRTRHDILGALRRHLPDGVSRVGLVCGVDDSELSLWMPYGHRSVSHLSASDLLEGRWQGLEWVAIKLDVLAGAPDTLDRLVSEYHLSVIARESITSKASLGAEDWVLVRLSNQARRSPND